MILPVSPGASASGLTMGVVQSQLDSGGSTFRMPLPTLVNSNSPAMVSVAVIFPKSKKFVANLILGAACATAASVAARRLGDEGIPPQIYQPIKPDATVEKNFFIGARTLMAACARRITGKQDAPMMFRATIDVKHPDLPFSPAI